MLNDLTPRQWELVRLVTTGLSNKSIAQRLGLQEGTVKIHLYNIYKKVGIPNRATLVMMALKHNQEAA